jgi:SAM-dependent methyltransferase
MHDRRGLIEAINAGREAKLELGSGGARARPGYVTVDLRDHPEVDIRGDVYDVLASLKDDCVSAIYASHFIEHIDDLNRFLKEVVRVCRDGASVEFAAPHFSNAFFYSDVTHRSFFGLYTFCYLAESRAGFRRQVPDYARIPGLVLNRVQLRFQSFRPFYIRHGFRKAVQLLVDSCNYMRELYEEAGTGFVSCYEVGYWLTVEKKGATATGELPAQAAGASG